MKGFLAIYLILFLLLPGCMMLPMALLPAFTGTPQPRQEATGSQALEQGQVVQQQNIIRR